MESGEQTFFEDDPQKPLQFGLGTVLLMCGALVGVTIGATMWAMSLGESADSDQASGSALVSDAGSAKRKSSGESKHATVSGADLENIPVYRMKQRDRHTYRLTISGGKPKVVLKKQCVYIMTPIIIDDWKTPDSSGTGFVVSADGYLATCAHVVARAKTIEVVLNEKTYPATVVSVNPQSDLAIIKIDAADLSVCHLGDSDQVELAETVRAFGFPLSTVLGTDLKAVTGSVSGIIADPKLGRRIQTDAAINPGNSGGPLVNDAGLVVGIASSKLSARTASAVGLAVPVNRLREMLTAAKIKWTQPSQSPEQKTGPEIARSVKSSVAFIRTSGFRGKVFDLDFQLSNGNRVPAGLSSLLRATGGQRDQKGEMRLSEFGEIMEQSGDPGPLPFLLGQLNDFCLLPLDHLGRDKWVRERNIILQLSPSGPTNLFSAILKQHQSSLFGARSRQKPPKMVPAEETINFEKVSETDGVMTVKRTYHLVTLDSPENPEMDVKGAGEIKFDLSLGLPTEGNYAGEVVHFSHGKRRVTPVEATFEHLTKAEIAEEDKAAKAELARNTKTTVTKNPNGSVTTTTVTQTPLGPIKRSSTTGGTRRSKSSSKRQVPLTEKQWDALVMGLSDPMKATATLKLRSGGSAAEAAVLRNFKKLTNEVDRIQAVDLLGHIGTKKSIPLLEELAKDGMFVADFAVKRIKKRETSKKK